MLLNPSHVVDDDFPDDWGINDTEEALAVSGVEDSWLKDCIVGASASVWGVPTMHPAQLEAAFAFSIPTAPILSLWSNARGGGGDSHPTNSWCD